MKIFVTKIFVVNNSRQVCDNTDYNGTAEFINLVNIVCKSGVPNVFGLQIPLPSNWKLEVFESYLIDYHDKFVINLIHCGFPIGHDGRETSKVIPKNHRGALEYQNEIDEYFKKEIAKDTVLGPLDINVFGNRSCFSPLNTREKPDTTERRILVDLSAPPLLSVNDGINKDLYLDREVDLRLPNIDKLVNLIHKHGVGCYLYRRDLRKAYRQVKICPKDVPLMGMVHRGRYLWDKVCVMGSSSSAHICQRVSDAIVYAFRKVGQDLGHHDYFDLLNYLDDLAGCSTESRVEFEYSELGKLLKDIGAIEAENKAIPPSTKMPFVGIVVDTVNMTLSIDDQKMEKLSTIINEWDNKLTASRKDVQQLVGFLSFLASVIPQGRLFFSRILSFLRGMPKRGSMEIPFQVREDIQWWRVFAPHFNGTASITPPKWEKPEMNYSSDSSMVGGGGWLRIDNKLLYFHVKYSEEIVQQAQHITNLEIYAITIACKLWGDKMKGKKWYIYCDNESATNMINKMKAKEEFAQKCLRNIAWVAAKNEFQLKSTHLSSAANRWSDLLSRVPLNQEFMTLFLELTADQNPVQCHVDSDILTLENLW